MGAAAVNDSQPPHGSASGCGRGAWSARVEERCAHSAAAGGGHAVRSRALGAPSNAVGRHACGRPRRGAVAAVLPHWDDDDDRLPGGRLTRALPPRANGHDRGAWCERRNRAASARWAPRSPGQPASRLHPRALVRAAFDNIGSDRRGLRARHADTHAQSNTHGARGLKVRRSPSIGRASRSPAPDHLALISPRRDHLKVPIPREAPRSGDDSEPPRGARRLRCGLFGSKK